MVRTWKEPGEDRVSLASGYPEWLMLVQLTPRDDDPEGVWNEFDKLTEELSIMAEYWGIDSTPLSRAYDVVFHGKKVSKELDKELNELVYRLDHKEWAEELNRPGYGGPGARSAQSADRPPAEIMSALSRLNQQVFEYLWSNPRTMYDELARNVPRWSTKDGCSDEAIRKAVGRLQLELYKAGFREYTVTAKNDYVTMGRRLNSPGEGQ